VGHLGRPYPARALRDPPGGVPELLPLGRDRSVLRGRAVRPAGPRRQQFRCRVVGVPLPRAHPSPPGPPTSRRASTGRRSRGPVLPLGGTSRPPGRSAPGPLRCGAARHRARRAHRVPVPRFPRGEGAPPERRVDPPVRVASVRTEIDDDPTGALVSRGGLLSRRGGRQGRRDLRDIQVRPARVPTVAREPDPTGDAGPLVPRPSGGDGSSPLGAPVTPDPGDRRPSR
jgi:hypothetical protein